jgi:hypothetical protein
MTDESIKTRLLEGFLPLFTHTATKRREANLALLRENLPSDALADTLTIVLLISAIRRR